VVPSIRVNVIPINVANAILMVTKLFILNQVMIVLYK
jgi:hypothetical protein